MFATDTWVGRSSLWDKWSVAAMLGKTRKFQCSCPASLCVFVKTKGAAFLNIVYRSGDIEKNRVMLFLKGRAGGSKIRIVRSCSFLTEHSHTIRNGGGKKVDTWIRITQVFRAVLCPTWPWQTSQFRLLPTSTTRNGLLMKNFRIPRKSKNCFYRISEPWVFSIFPSHLPTTVFDCIGNHMLWPHFAERRKI